jgi:hypothetical protein
MKIVRSNLYYLINENMDQARSILKKAGIPEQDDTFQQLKQMLLNDNKIGYIGKFTKWLIVDKEPWAKLIEVYEMVKKHTGKVPPIDTFKTLESLFDYLQGSGINTKLNQVINSIPSKARRYVNNDLKKLIELNIKYAKSLSDFYSKKGGKFKNAKDLYNETQGLIENLSGKFNLETYLKKIKNMKNVEIMYQNADVLVIRPMDYEASCELGSKSWCISYSKNYWDSYADIFSNQYFVYDFTKPMSDKTSMIGITIGPNGEYKAAHFKDDSVCPIDYLKII